MVRKMMMVKESENHYKNQTGKKAKWKSSTVKSSLIMQEEKLQKETFSRFLIHPLICLFIEKSYLPILNYCCGRTTTVVLVPSIRLTNCSSLTSWQHTHASKVVWVKWKQRWQKGMWGRLFKKEILVFSNADQNAWKQEKMKLEEEVG